MLIVPIQPVANQTLAALLSTQVCQLNIYQKNTGIYMDVLVNDDLVIGGVACQDRNRIIRSLYFGFQGDFAFFDTQGADNPFYTGLGSRFKLIYIEPSELPPGVG